MLQIVKHIAWRCGIAPDRAAHKVISNCPIAESIDRFYEIMSASDSKCEVSAVAGCPNEVNVNAVALVRVSKALREPMPIETLTPPRFKCSRRRSAAKAESVGYMVGKKTRRPERLSMAPTRVMYSTPWTARAFVCVRLQTLHSRMKLVEIEVSDADACRRGTLTAGRCTTPPLAHS